MLLLRPGKSCLKFLTFFHSSQSSSSSLVNDLKPSTSVAAATAEAPFVKAKSPVKVTATTRRSRSSSSNSSLLLSPTKTSATTKAKTTPNVTQEEKKSKKQETSGQKVSAASRRLKNINIIKNPALERAKQQQAQQAMISMVLGPRPKWSDLNISGGGKSSKIPKTKGGGGQPSTTNVAQTMADPVPEAVEEPHEQPQQNDDNNNSMNAQFKQEDSVAVDDDIMFVEEDQISQKNHQELAVGEQPIVTSNNDNEEDESSSKPNPYLQLDQAGHDDDDVDQSEEYVPQATLRPLSAKITKPSPVRTNKVEVETPSTSSAPAVESVPEDVAKATEPVLPEAISSTPTKVVQSTPKKVTSSNAVEPSASTAAGETPSTKATPTLSASGRLQRVRKKPKRWEDDNIEVDFGAFSVESPKVVPAPAPEASKGNERGRKSTASLTVSIKATPGKSKEKQEEIKQEDDEKVQVKDAKIEIKHEAEEVKEVKKESEDEKSSVQAETIESQEIKQEKLVVSHVKKEESKAEESDSASDSDDSDEEEEEDEDAQNEDSDFGSDDDPEKLW